MNRDQWFFFSLGLMSLSIFLFAMASGSGICSSYSGEMMTSCFIRRYSFAIPAIITFFVSIVSLIFGFLERKKKH